MKNNGVKVGLMTLVSLVIFLLGSAKVFAATPQRNYTLDELIDYVTEGSASVVAFDGIDHTDEFNLYMENHKSNHDDAKQWLVNSNCFLRKQEVEEPIMSQGVMAVRDKYKFVRDYFGFGLNGTNGVGYIEVTSELHCGAWFDIVNERVTRIDTPVYLITGIYCNVNADVMANNIQTGSYIRDGVGYFWGQCSFSGRLLSEPATLDITFPTRRVSTDTNHLGM